MAHLEISAPGVLGSCGAVIKNDSYVVSAAHCFVDEVTDRVYPNMRVEVSAGMLDIYACNVNFKQTIYVSINASISAHF